MLDNNYKLTNNLIKIQLNPLGCRTSERHNDVDQSSNARPQKK